MQALSAALLRAEQAVAGAMAAAIFGLVTLGALARSLGLPLVWTDELAVHLMAMLAFIAASMGVALQNHMVMGLIPEVLGPRGQLWLARLNQLLILAFMGVMAGLVWLWLDLPGLWAAGSAEALAETTFNFVWLDPTLTLGLRKIWFWFVIPLSTLTAALHALALLVRKAPL